LVEGRDFMFANRDETDKGSSVNKMNRIYNSLDAFLTTSTGEGWGLTITEAMACKVPVIAPNHTSIQEITNQGYNAFLLNSLYPVVSMVDNIVRFQSDIYEIADTINQVREAIYDDSQEYRNKLQRAYDYVEKLDWKWIAGKFADEIKRLA
jgi:glycosyltransferase involved in cell wall biosynthesis